MVFSNRNSLVSLLGCCEAFSIVSAAAAITLGSRAKPTANGGGEMKKRKSKKSQKYNQK